MTKTRPVAKPQPASPDPTPTAPAVPAIINPALKEAKKAKAKAAVAEFTKQVELAAPIVAASAGLIRCAYHDAFEDPSLFARNKAHKNGYASSCKAGLKARSHDFASRKEAN